MYGRRHVLCPVAIRRLQREGLSLDEIRDRLDGLTAAELEALAAVPARVIPGDLDEVPPAPGPARRFAGAGGAPTRRSCRPNARRQPEGGRMNAPT